MSMCWKVGGEEVLSTWKMLGAGGYKGGTGSQRQGSGQTDDGRSMRNRSRLAPPSAFGKFASHTTWHTIQGKHKKHIVSGRPRTHAVGPVVIDPVTKSPPEVEITEPIISAGEL